MKLDTARRVIRDDPVIQIGELGSDDDGGLRPLSYWVQRELPQWPGLEAKPLGPPRIPREDLPDPLAIVAAGIFVGLFWVLAVVGAAAVVRGLLGG